jgi:hypothetical protein
MWSGEKQVGKGFRSGKVCEVVDYWFLPQNISKYFRAVFFNPEHG